MRVIAITELRPIPLAWLASAGVGSPAMRTCGSIMVACVLASACRDDGSASTTADASTGGSSGGAGSSGAPADGSGTSTGELPSPYSDGTGSDEQPTAMPDAVAQAIGDGLEVFLQADPDGMIAAFEAFAVFDADCPEQQLVADGITQFASEGCTTAAGLTFEGAGTIERKLDVVEGDRTVTGATLSSQGSNLRVTAGDGRYFHVSGDLVFERGVGTDGSHDGYFAISGDLVADADTAAGFPILAGELRPQGYLYAYMGEGYRGIGGDGSVTGSALTDVVAMSFAQAQLGNAPCADEPAGQYSVRDADGYWHDVVFDAAHMVDDEYQWDGTCDGCGTYLAGGIESGQACMPGGEMTSLLAWEEIPW